MLHTSKFSRSGSIFGKLANRNLLLSFWGFRNAQSRSYYIPIFLKRTAFVRKFTSSAQRFTVADGKNSGTPKVSNPIGEIKPSYKLTFTCKKCNERSDHNVSKQAYHNGTVIVRCPGCENLHLIADNLKIFSDTSINLDDILSKKGEAVRKGFHIEGDTIEYEP